MRLLALLTFVLSQFPLAASEAILRNPTVRPYPDEVLRAPFAAPAGEFAVTVDGAVVPSQVEAVDGVRDLWLRASFAPGQVATVATVTAQPVAKPLVKVVRDGSWWVLDNGLVAVRVPAEGEAAKPPAPIAGVRVGQRWAGSGAWRLARAGASFTATVIGSGAVRGRVRLEYRFTGTGGATADEPASAIVDVVLAPGMRHVEIAERHRLSRGEGWDFDLAAGWAPREGIAAPFSSGPGGPVGTLPPKRRPLLPGALPVTDPEIFLCLVPRWNQHYKDGWHVAATDGTDAVAATAVRNGSWEWVQDNAIRACVRPAGDALVLRLPGWAGARRWWLSAGSVADVGTMAKEYLVRYAFEPLDRLNREFILDWPGKTGSFKGEFQYDGGMINPTGGIRGRGRAAIKAAGAPGDISLLTNTQYLLAPDCYGTYAQFCSPENPNFLSDFLRLPLMQATRLKDHPRFAEIRALCQSRFEEDLVHSVTMPGGAGQECPGYLKGALDVWHSMAPACRDHLGFDPTTYPRFIAAEGFLRRISQPDGAIRRMLPIGDTHPGKDGPAPVEVDAAEVAAWTTAELPGFGVIFNHRPGTPRETYLAFKAGSNRGHYHGDQLAVHWGANARPIAVDHHCSYRPRAGQDHMHNRVAFSTADMPWANLDGYERLIAFRAGAISDIAVAQVESPRLRTAKELPPEDWHAVWPMHQLGKPLTYRRTVVFLRGQGEAADAVVLRDQWWGGDASVLATWCMHLLSDRVERPAANVFRAISSTGSALITCLRPANAAYTPFAWQHDNGGHEATQGIRLAAGTAREFLTVLCAGEGPPGGITAIPGGVRVGTVDVVFAETPPEQDAPELVRVSAGGATDVLAGKDLDLDRSQGDIGLFVPDAGYPFGDIPAWLIRQRLHPGKP